MQYREQIPFFRRELAQLGRPFPNLSFESFRQVMARAPTPEADEACRAFAATLEWPPLSEDTRLEVCFRLLVWIEWLEAYAGEEPFPGEDGKIELASALISYWRDQQPALARFWREWPGGEFPCHSS